MDTLKSPISRVVTSSALLPPTNVIPALFSEEKVLKFKLTYQVMHDVYRHCGVAGSWDGSPPSCNPISCGNPPAVVNGLVELFNGLTSWQAVASYQCLPPFTNYGNGELVAGETKAIRDTICSKLALGFGYALCWGRDRQNGLDSTE